MGTLKAIWETNTDAKPSLTPIAANSIRNDAPMMTSGLTINTLFSVNRALLNCLLLTWVMAIAPATPIIVDMAAENKAIARVFRRMMTRRVSWNTSPYHSSVNPSKLCIDPPLLKE
ncbi:MAG: hypothetical protein BWY92_01910 [Firmicutes bacterium ADurb.BinA052]|nr:MAG: hypothetical protein BWY92_01910 [Firmicutes bacterium ADurb.BinA052]